MVEMRVREVDVDIERRLARQLEPERADAGAGVEDQPPAAGGDFQARRVAAIAGVLGAGTRNRAAHAPEADFQTLGQYGFPETICHIRVHRWRRGVNRTASWGRSGRDLA